MCIRDWFYACVGMGRGALQRRLSGVQMLVSELRRGELETYLGGRMEELEQYRSRMDALIARVVLLGEAEGLFAAADPWGYRRFVFGSAVASSAMAGGVCLQQGGAPAGRLRLRDASAGPAGAAKGGKGLGIPAPPLLPAEAALWSGPGRGPGPLSAKSHALRRRGRGFFVAFHDCAAGPSLIQ